MRFAEYAGYAGALFLASCFFFGSREVQAKAQLPAGAHDGVYAIRINTLHGSCHKTYSTTIAVRHNQIHPTGAGAALARGSGHIGSGGKVSGTFRLLHHPVSVTGRIEGHSGSGKWSSQSLGCSGSWHAARRS